MYILTIGEGKGEDSLRKWNHLAGQHGLFEIPLGENINLFTCTACWVSHVMWMPFVDLPK